METSQKTLNFIYKRHLPSLKHLDHKYPKLLVLFSGVPGSGKTTLAKKVEQKLNAVRINNDIIRDVIGKHELSKKEGISNGTILQEYLLFLMEKLKNKNGLIIVDSSVDRKFEIIREFADTNKFKMFLIKIDVSREEIEKRIIARESDNSAEAYFSQLDRWFADFEEFNSKHTADFVYKCKASQDLSKLLLRIKSSLPLLL